MNYKLLKDKKAMTGFASSIILSGIGVVLAIYDISYWVAFAVLSLIILSPSVRRAGRYSHDAAN